VNRWRADRRSRFRILQNRHAQGGDNDKTTLKGERPGLGLTRRQLLSRSVAAGASFVVGAGFVASRQCRLGDGNHRHQTRSMATLIQMARDIYPHDQVPDRILRHRRQRL
jgi:hypothetical protein